MFYSYNWLKEHFEQLPSLKNLADLITLRVAEVETLQKVDENLNNIFLGKIISIKRHPRADRLWLAEVSLGKKRKYQVVCGGINLKEGMLVALALPGSKVKLHNQGEIIEISKSKIRGEISDGMICAPNEIGLENLFSEYSEGEILDLSSIANSSDIGYPISEVLGLNDTLIEVENKNITHRPDLWSYLGMAREISAILDLPLKKEKDAKSNRIISSQVNRRNLKVKVLDRDNCLSYSIFSLTNFKISPSPFWLKRKIFLAGHHPINNLVDLTNYIMFEFGQPMHAFDRKKIKGSTLIVRSAKKGEKIRALNNQTYILTASDLVIADQNNPLVLAGVIGGESSAVDDSTEEAILEVANFNSVRIRKTSQRLQVSTDSSKRFERKINPLWTKEITANLPNILPKIFPEAIVKPIFNYQSNLEKTIISFNFLDCSKVVGAEIKSSQKILGRLGFKFQKEKVVVPVWRSDILLKEDLIEEIIRINGLDKVPSSLPRIILRSDIDEDKTLFFIEEMKKFLALSLGMDEVLNYSFFSEEQIKLFGFSRNNLIGIKNALSKNQIALRSSLIPGLVSNLQKNQYYFKQINIFEAGSVYLATPGDILAKTGKKEFLPEQKLMVAGLIADCSLNRLNLFLTAKGKVETFLNYWRVKFCFKKTKHPWLRNCLQIGDFGFLGELDSRISYQLKIDCPVVVFELDVQKMIGQIEREIKYFLPRKFNLIIRDIKLKLSSDISYDEFLKDISRIDKRILKVEIIDVFQDYFTLRLFLGEDDKNITDQIANEIVEKVRKKLLGMLS